MKASAHNDQRSVRTTADRWVSDSTAGLVRRGAPPFFRFVFQRQESLLQRVGQYPAHGPGKKPGHESFKGLFGSHSGAVFFYCERPCVNRANAHSTPEPDNSKRRCDVFNARTNLHASGLPAKLGASLDFALKVHLLDALIPLWPFCKIGQNAPNELDGRAYMGFLPCIGRCFFVRCDLFHGPFLS